MVFLDVLLEVEANLLEVLTVDVADEAGVGVCQRAGFGARSVSGHGPTAGCCACLNVAAGALRGFQSRDVVLSSMMTLFLARSSAKASMMIPLTTAEKMRTTEMW